MPKSCVNCNSEIKDDDLQKVMEVFRSIPYEVRNALAKALFGFELSDPMVVSKIKALGERFVCATCVINLLPTLSA